MKYITCRVGDLFDIHPTKAYKGNNSDIMSSDGTIPVVANNSVNNGIGGYSKLDPTEKGGIITFSDTTTSDSIFFQPSDFIGYAHVQGMYPKSDKWTHNSLKYFMVIFKKCAQSIGFDYGNKFNRKIAADFQISLPSKDGINLDFEYMDSYIHKIEKEYSDRVEKFIKENLLKAAEISQDDLEILNEKKTYKEFSFDCILEKVKTKNLCYKVKSLPKKPVGKYVLPALTAGINNQGLSCYVPYNGATVLKNCISVSANGANSGAMFYQPNNFTVLQDSYALRPIHKNVTGFAQLYLISVMQHVIKGNYSWTNKAGWERIKSNKMILPVDKNGNPDYYYMDVYIRNQEMLLLNNLL